ncbi:MAG: type II secretion system protein GspG [Candidatus Levybacteria bacterium]|nr:type II secretion system protein GspG [Candidatus Levybacteria bacterium]
MNKDLSYTKIKKSLKSYFLNLKSSFGFTLIEILIVLALIGILSVIFFINFSVIPKARDAQRKADLKQLEKAVEQYRSDNGIYPNNNGITELLNCPVSPPLTYFGDDIASDPCETTYLNKIPVDPRGSAYWYGGKYLYYSGDGLKYYIAACTENKNDKDSFSRVVMITKISQVFGVQGVNALTTTANFTNDCKSTYGFLIIGQ